MKNKVSIFLALLLSFSFVACDNSSSDSGSNEVSYGTLSDSVLWGTLATEKVLQDVSGGYDNVKLGASISVDAAKGEYEAQQIIITAKNKKLAYTVELFDLQTADGEEFSKENIEVFHEKYLNLTTEYDKTGSPLGKYPDALVPYKNIVDKGENVVEPNQNQGLYFRFNVPIEQAEGVYSGKAKITIGGESQEIPISLNVWDLTVSEEYHSRSFFLTRWFQYAGELDTTQDMLDKYTNALYEYRLNGSDLMLDTTHSPADIQEYVDLAYEHMQNPKCSTVSIPGKQANVGFDVNTFRSYLLAFAEKSFETNYNMMEKLAFFENYIDEPQQWNGLESTKQVATQFRTSIEYVASKIEKDATITSPIKDEVVASIRKIPNVITAHYSKDYEPYVDTWCPTFDHYDSPVDRENYADQGEKWWYGCVVPKAPYPTYHIEDTLLSARLESWMKAEYDVVGNLYWAVNVFGEYTGQNYVDIEDYYTGNASRWPGVNGDGFLFYPGKYYGIDGPIGSIRLEAIRDGLEEYELMYELDNNYENVSATLSAIDPSLAFDSDKVMSVLTSSLYTGTRVMAETESFYASRNALYQLARLNQKAGVCVADFYDNCYGQYVFTLVAPEGVVLKQGGNVLQSEETIAGYNKYIVNVDLVNDKNSLNIVAEVDGKAYEYTQYVGGKATLNKVESVNTADFGKETVSPVVSLVDANVIDSSLSGKLLKITVPEVGNRKEQAFTMKGAMLEGVDSTASKWVFHVYYTGNDNVKYTISGKFSKKAIYYDLATINLQPGINTIEIDLMDKDWDALGSLVNTIMYLGGREGEPERTLYLIDSVVYKR